jgi:hypothetical protein
MTFLKTNINTEDKKQVYRMTKGDSQKIEGLERGLSIPVDQYALYTEVKDRKKQDGTTEQYEQTVLTFTSGPHKFGTISATFIKSFLEIVEIMDGDPFAIIITGGESKSGRKYVNCELDCDFEPEA